MTSVNFMTSEIHELLNSGDWACAYAQEEDLARVCRELAGEIEPALADEVHKVARLAEHDDMLGASRLWTRLTTVVRLGS